MGEEKLNYTDYSNSEENNKFLYRFFDIMLNNDKVNTSIQYSTEYNDSMKYHYIICEVQIGGEVLKVDLEDYVDNILEYGYKQISKASSSTEQITVSSQFTFVINHIIYHTNSILRRADIDYYPYNFDSILTILKNHIENLKLELEAEKLEKENKTYRIPLYFSGAAVIIALLSPLTSRIVDYYFPLEKEQATVIQPTTNSIDSTTEITAPQPAQNVTK